MKKIIRTSTQYVINGRTYRSLEEMPPEDRKFFEDANRNGIPDGFETLMSGGMKDGVVQTTQAGVDHCEVVESAVVSDGRAGLDRDAIRQILGADEAQAHPEERVPPLSPPPPAKHSVTYSLDLKTVVIVVLIGVILVLVTLLLRR